MTYSPAFSMQQSDVDRRVMITLKREETEGQALSELHEKDLLDYFSSYGKIQHVNWIRDRATNAVKGYGFVTFYDTDSFKEAVKRKRHMLGGRQVNVFPATEREKNSSIQKRKIVVKRHRGWKGEMDLTRIQDYFSKFGEIEKVDAKNLQTKGYMHITFKNEESVESILLDNQHDIDGEIMFVLRTHSSDQQWNQWRLEKELIQKLKILKIKEGLQVNEKMGTHVTVVIPKKFKHCISEESLEEHFSSYGEIEKAFILRNEVTMESKGCGMVTFKDSHVVEEILAAGKHKIDDVEIFVKKSLIDDE